MEASINLTIHSEGKGTNIYAAIALTGLFASGNWELQDHLRDQTKSNRTDIKFNRRNLSKYSTCHVKSDYSHASNGQLGACYPAKQER